MLAFKI